MPCSRVQPLSIHEHTYTAKQQLINGSQTLRTPQSCAPRLKEQFFGPSRVEPPVKPNLDRNLLFTRSTNRTSQIRGSKSTDAQRFLCSAVEGNFGGNSPLNRSVEQNQNPAQHPTGKHSVNRSARPPVAPESWQDNSPWPEPCELDDPDQSVRVFEPARECVWTWSSVAGGDRSTGRDRSAIARRGPIDRSDSRLDSRDRGTWSRWCHDHDVRWGARPVPRATRQTGQETRPYVARHDTRAHRYRCGHVVAWACANHFLDFANIPYCYTG